MAASSDGKRRSPRGNTGTAKRGGRTASNAKTAKTAKTAKAAKSTKADGKATGKRNGSAATAPDSRVRDHLRDAWGIGLVVVAALTALGLYADAAGIVGNALALLFLGLFGVFGYLAPPALAAGGVILLRDPRPGMPRVLIGLTVTSLAVAGLWHLARGAPPWGAPVEELHAAAGWFGATVAVPLSAVAAVWGSVVLLLPLVVLGLLITTATPPRRLLRRGGEAVARMRARAAERRARRDIEDAEVVDAVDDDEAPSDDDEAPTRLGGGGDDTLAEEAVAPALVDEEATAVLDGDESARTPEPADEASDTQLLPQGVSPKAATRLRPPDDEWSEYELPGLELLRTGRAATGGKRSREQMTRALERTLQQFGVDAAVGRVASGPTVTRFELSLGEGTRVGAVTKLGDDISYALATPEIRIVAPIPGKSAIGIEVPNRERGLVTLGDVLRSPEAGAQAHPLTVGLGVDIAGNPVLINLAKMPHLLIAGATGSGKSVTMNGIVTSVLMRATPAEVRMILVDPKRVELNHYEGAPHLLTPVVTDPKRATEALAWAVTEMEQRYERLAMLGFRNIDAYNEAVVSGRIKAPAASGQADRNDGGASGEAPTWEPLPYMLFVIDELADLMMVAPRDVEGHIVRIAQMARAVGIHLIVATQRPSVDVVTGLIKANVPSRIALAMATQADSRTILDQGGAEKLVGDGDMLFTPANASKPHRIQGCYLSETEIEAVVGACKGQRHADHVEGIVKTGSDAQMADITSGDASDGDLTEKAMELVVRSGLGSTSMLQRKLKVGFARAGRIMDELEELGVVGPSEGSKARQVLMTVDEWESRNGGGNPGAGPPGVVGGSEDVGEEMQMSQDTPGERR
jgi:DNA segregation ATPase FtsK/SpoIIIE, S-DNA-T family